MSGLFSPDVALPGWFDDEFVFSGPFDPDLSVWRFATASLTDQDDALASAGHGLPRGSVLASDASDSGISTGTVSITGILAVTESPQGLPGAYWSTRYWAASYWVSRYWTPNTPPNPVLVQATLDAADQADAVSGGAFWNTRYWAQTFWASGYWSTTRASNAALVGAALSVTDAPDTEVSAGICAIVGALGQAESADSISATGTAAGGVIGAVSGSLAAQDDDDALHATVIRVGAVLPAGAVGWWPHATTKPQRRTIAHLAVVDGDDRVAVRVRTAAIAVSRLIESSDRSASISRSTSGASLVLTDVADRLRMRASVDWSGLIAQEDESLAFGEDDLLMSELMREAA